MTMVRSSVSAFAGTAGVAGLGVVVVGEAEGLSAATLVCAGIAGALPPGFVACGLTIGGFGPKKRIHSRITAIDRSDASKRRSSCESGLFSSDPFTNGPLDFPYMSARNPSRQIFSSPLVPGPDRNQTFATAGGTAATAC